MDIEAERDTEHELRASDFDESEDENTHSRPSQHRVSQELCYWESHDELIDLSMSAHVDRGGIGTTYDWLSKDDTTVENSRGKGVILPFCSDRGLPSHNTDGAERTLVE